MVKDPNGAPEGARGFQEGRTADELHGSFENRSPQDGGRPGHAISERLDGAYVPDSGDRNARAVHGWYYPDRPASLSKVDSETPPSADERRY